MAITVPYQELHFREEETTLLLAWRERTLPTPAYWTPPLYQGRAVLCLGVLGQEVISK